MQDNQFAFLSDMELNDGPAQGADVAALPAPTDPVIAESVPGIAGHQAALENMFAYMQVTEFKQDFFKVDDEWGRFQQDYFRSLVNVFSHWGALTGDDNAKVPAGHDWRKYARKIYNSGRGFARATPFIGEVNQLRVDSDKFTPVGKRIWSSVKLKDGTLNKNIFLGKLVDVAGETRYVSVVVPDWRTTSQGKDWKSRLASDGVMLMYSERHSQNPAITPEDWIHGWRILGPNYSDDEDPDRLTFSPEADAAKLAKFYHLWTTPVGQLL
jgi:hypothetical protein